MTAHTLTFYFSKIHFNKMYLCSSYGFFSSVLLLETFYTLLTLVLAT